MDFSFVLKKRTAYGDYMFRLIVEKNKNKNKMIFFEGFG